MPNKKQPKLILKLTPENILRWLALHNSQDEPENESHSESESDNTSSDDGTASTYSSMTFMTLESDVTLTSIGMESEPESEPESELIP